MAKKPPLLNYDKVKGRITTLKAIPYKGHMIYLRRIDIEIFEYLVVYNNEVYSSYWIIKPRKGEKDLDESEVAQAGGLTMAGACATIDMLTGKKVDKKTMANVEAFEKGRQKVASLPN